MDKYYSPQHRHACMCACQAVSGIITVGDSCWVDANGRSQTP